MKTLLAFQFLFLMGNVLAQEDSYHASLKSKLQTQYGITGGAWVFPPNETANTANTSGSGGTRTLVQINGQAFTKATQLAIVTVPQNPWNAGMALNTSQAIAAGDRLLLVFWARTISAPNQIGMGCFTFENNKTYTKELAFEQRVGPGWKQYLVPIQAKASHPPGGAKFALQLGVAAQTMQIGGLALINYQQSRPLSSLPTVSNDEYAGMESDAPWRAAAAARIEQYRKANLGVVVLDKNSAPITGAQVKLEMVRHDYAFGTAINEGKITGDKSQGNTYQEKLFNLDGKGHGFSEVVFENGHKWAAWEGDWGGTKAKKAATVKWLSDHGIRVRGHTLLWPGWKNSPKDLKNEASNLPTLTKRINAHLDEMLNFPGMKGVIKEWDVVNEPTGNVDIANAFKGTPGYVTGREVYAEIFNRVLQIDPSVKKYMNEAHLSNFYVNSDFFRAIVKEVGAKGGKIDGVGFQAHFRYMIPPEELYAHFEDYHKITGGTVKITEYDNKTLAPAALEAAYFRDLLTITFSHPYSDGFIMWGFWDGAHYAKRAPLFDLNWNLKPAGKPFIDLVFNQWWTPATTLKVDSEGKVALRGFKGVYKVTIQTGTEEFVDTVNLTSDSALIYKQPFARKSGVAEINGQP